MWMINHHECSLGLAFTRYSADTVWTSNTSCPYQVSPSSFMNSDNKFIFRKKSKVYWNFKLHLKNQNPNPGDFQQDKVSESGKCSLSQNLLTRASWVHFPGPKGMKTSYSSRLPQDFILWLTPKFPTRIKKKEKQKQTKPKNNPKLKTKNVKSKLIFSQPHSM